MIDLLSWDLPVITLMDTKMAVAAGKRKLRPTMTAFVVILSGY
jgi:hypothetical protein